MTMDSTDKLADTKRLMGALVRMKPKPHDEMKLKLKLKLKLKTKVTKSPKKTAKG